MIRTAAAITVPHTLKTMVTQIATLISNTSMILVIACVVHTVGGLVDV